MGCAKMAWEREKKNAGEERKSLTGRGAFGRMTGTVGEVPGPERERRIDHEGNNYTRRESPLEEPAHNRKTTTQDH
jgi:hypothetical protein